MTWYIFKPDGSADILDYRPAPTKIHYDSIIFVDYEGGYPWRTFDNYTIPENDPRITKEIRLKLLLLKD